MLLKRSDKRSHPYAALTVGTLAVIGAVKIVRCGKRHVRCIKNKVKSLIGLGKCDKTCSD